MGNIFKGKPGKCMARITYIIFATVIVFLLIVSVSKKSFAGNDIKNSNSPTSLTYKLVTDNFIIYSDTSQKDLKYFEIFLEGLRKYVNDEFFEIQKKIPLNVYLFKMVFLKRQQAYVGRI